jgi:hypothetical protein
MCPVSHGDIPVPSLRAFKVLTIFAPSHDSSFKPNYSVRDVTKNLRNLRPTFELREHYQYNNQVMTFYSSVLAMAYGRK